MNEGFILIHRKILEWEWYSNINDRLVWLHCLLSVNWKDGWFEGQKIQRGSFVTSLNKLSKEIGISIQQVRTSLNHLKSTNNLTYETNHQFSIITINNYNTYQLDQQTKQQTTNKRATNEQQTINNNRMNNNKEQLITINNNKDIIYNNIYVDYETEFDELWNLYPKKQGKKDALRHYIKARKKGISKEVILEGINNYKKYIKLNNIDMQYVKMGSSWFNQESWKDDYTIQEKKDLQLELLKGVYNGEIKIN